MDQVLAADGSPAPDDDVGCVCSSHIGAARFDGARIDPGRRVTVTVTRPACADAVTVLRRLVRLWSEDCTLDEATADDMVLAVDEAVSNVVEHAYPDRVGFVRLQLTRRECGEVTVDVDDRGTWRPSPGPVSRGRGLLLMHRLADHVRVRRTPRGTTVRMRWMPRS